MIFKMAEHDWTDEQIKLIYLYGKCRVCGWPMAGFHDVEVDEAGAQVHTMGRRCTNPEEHRPMPLVT